VTRDFEIIGEFNDFKERIDNAAHDDALCLLLFQEWLALKGAAGDGDE